LIRFYERSILFQQANSIHVFYPIACISNGRSDCNNFFEWSAGRHEVGLRGFFDLQWRCRSTPPDIMTAHTMHQVALSVPT
jgi:hypothetical protein